MTKFKVGDRVKHNVPNYWAPGNPTGTVVSVAETSGPGGLDLYGVEVDGDTFPEPWKHREKDLVAVSGIQEIADTEIWAMIYDLRGTRPRHREEISTEDLIKSLRTLGVRFVREA
jgi:hypothetical protein